MILILKIAWLNTFRQKRRTLLVTSAIAVGLAAMIISDGLMRGLTTVMVKNATGTFMGEAQLHAKGFRDSQDVDLNINLGSVAYQTLAKDPAIKHIAARVSSSVMLASSYQAKGAMLYGIEPDNERHLSILEKAIISGVYLAADAKNDIIIGKTLAEDLKVGLGDRIVITGAEAKGSQISQALFRVKGIFFHGNRQIDGNVAAISLAKAQEFFNLGNRAHEIALTFTKIANTEKFLNQPLPSDWELLGWQDLMPSLVAIFEMSDISMAILSLILFAIIALSIINTLYQALHERAFEFGVLKAIGTKPTEIATMILLEAGTLCLISLPIGLILGLGLNGLLGVIGLDYTGTEFAGVTLTSKVYNEFAWPQYTIFPAITFLLTLIVAIYPAFSAARIVPADALRKSL